MSRAVWIEGKLVRQWLFKNETDGKIYSSLKNFNAEYGEEIEGDFILMDEYFQIKDFPGVSVDSKISMVTTEMIQIKEEFEKLHQRINVITGFQKEIIELVMSERTVAQNPPKD